MNSLIGLDIGTTNVKAVAFDDIGNIVAAASRPNRIYSPQPGWSEQEPEAVFQNVLAVLLDVNRLTASSRREGRLQGVVFSSAMHGLVAVNADNHPLTNFLLWSDLRADDIARSLRRGGEGEALYRRTGVPVHSMSPAIKLCWLRQNRPEIFQNAHKFLGIKDFIWQRLTGKFQADLSVASASGLMNIWQNEWDELAMHLAGVSPEQLPALVPPSTTASFSENSALPESVFSGIPLIIGASDGALANLGSGAMKPGQVAATVGTSAAIRAVTQAPVLDERMRTFCYRLDERRCIVGGASNNGTNVLEWLRSAVFQSRLDAEHFANQALIVPAGSDGLIFWPYLLGERAPLYDASARAGFQGLTARHQQAHFVRAAMESVIFNLLLIAGALEEREPVQTLHAGGGFSQNELWVQMLADIFQKPVFLQEEGADASVRGAIMLGREVLNLKQMPVIQKVRSVEPNPGHAEAYREAFQRFRDGWMVGWFDGWIV